MDNYVDYFEPVESSEIDHNETDNLQAAGTGVTYGHVNDQAQTISGVKTFESFPVTPSADPTSDYEVANKQYVDGLTATYTVYRADASGLVYTMPTTPDSKDVMSIFSNGLLICSDPGVC